MPAKAIITQTKEKMQKSLISLEEKLGTLRTGRASANQYEHITVDYYGAPTPLNQVSNISIPEPRLVVIQAWDTTVLPAIEKAIMNSNMSVNPQNDGKVIRIQVPPLTDATRQQNIKQAKDLGEEAKVAIRNIRRDANDKLKKLQHDASISEDDLKSYEHEIQDLTDDTIKKIQSSIEKKEVEIKEA